MASSLEIFENYRIPDFYRAKVISVDYGTRDGTRGDPVYKEAENFMNAPRRSVTQ